MNKRTIKNLTLSRQSLITEVILKAIRGGMTGMVYSLEAKDEYSSQHSNRVSEMAKRFSEILGNDKVKTEEINLAASVHDIGKIGIPDQVLLCPGKLSDDQWKIMKSHPVIGAEILKRTAEALHNEVRDGGFLVPIPGIVIGQIEEIQNAILHHHERWDGSGYPDGLAGDDIPYISRIIALCDSTDAMMSKRVYRNPLTPDTCKEELKKNTGVMYDPNLAEIFIEHFDEITKDIFNTR